jgi:hypothetical protein
MIEHREGQVGSFHDEAGQKVRSHRHQTLIRPTGTKTTIVETANRFARDLMVQEIGFAMLKARYRLCRQQSNIVPGRHAYSTAHPARFGRCLGVGEGNAGSEIAACS